jgi:mono/diheme cytochrome c family protein
MLKKIFKGALVALLVLTLALVGFVALRQNRTFDAPYPAIKASGDSAVIARGKYLVYGAAHCADCHSPVGTEEKVDAGETVPLSGGRYFQIPPARLYVPNITPDPSGIGNMKDEVIARALRYGVGHDGRALFDFMPFHNTSDEDLTAIISYIRSTDPVHNEVPKSEYSVLGRILKALVLEPVGPSMEVPEKVTPDSSVEYGRYLAVSVANCRGCHTDRDLKTGAFIGKDYAGGFAMESPMDSRYTFYTPNISPDKQTGKMASWTEEQFIKRFRQGKIIHQSPMPWGPFSRLDEQELKAIYRFLQTVTPVEKKIEHTYVVAD